MATVNERFGQRVKKLREQRKMSQLALAQKSKLDLTTINELENGNRDPMLKTIWKIANALDVKILQLFDF
ncbi:helix-turn-helix transcriptional regulator [Candidatus Daviesbacteria bacterium]|nr:helix-turn-helix transcriptional regulator [Candidatus Daviesbacteria bacterium]